MSDNILIDGIEYSKEDLLKGHELINKLNSIYSALTNKVVPVKFELFFINERYFIGVASVCERDEISFCENYESWYFKSDKPKEDKGGIPNYIS